MKTTAFSCALLVASAVAAPVLRPTPVPRADKDRRQIGVNIIGSTTISGADVSAFAVAAASANATDSASPPAATTDSSGSASSSSSSGGSSSSSNSGSSGDVSGSSNSSSSASGSQSGSSGDVSGSSNSSSSASGSESSGSQSSGSSNSSSSASGSQSSGSSNSSSSGSSSGSGSSGSSGSSGDLTVLNFALVLEQLETAFYQAGLGAFDKAAMVAAGLSGTQADILIQTFQQQGSDESTHVSVLESLIKSLGGEAVSSCKFDFSSVLSNPATFIATARTLELVGVSAYAGGASLISDKSILTDAASILSIEARHQSSLNVFSGGTFAAQAFDIPLTPESVLALAGGFLQGCSAEDLGLSANQPLSIINSATGNTLISVDTVLAFESPVLTPDIDASTLTCQMIVGGKSEAIVQDISNCAVPEGINGPVMVFVSNDKTPLSADVTKQNNKQIVAGPAAIFVDAGTETFQQIFSVQGFGIEQLASIDLGSLIISQQISQVTVIDIISESNPNSKNSIQISNGMYQRDSNKGNNNKSKHSKRAPEPFGVRVLGWN